MKRGVTSGGFISPLAAKGTQTSVGLTALRSLGDFLHFVSDIPKSMLSNYPEGFPIDGLTPNLASVLDKSCLHHMNSLTGEHIGRILALYASQKVFSEKVLRRMSERLQDSRFSGFSGKDVALVLNSFVRLSYKDEKVFRLASSYLLQLPGTEFISEKYLALICNSYARVGIIDRDLFDVLAERIRGQIPALSSQSCGNICHAFGKLGIDSPASIALLAKVAKHAGTRLAKKLSAQEISNILYSLGNLGMSDPEYLDPILKLAEENIRHGKPIEVAAVSSAVSKLGVSNESLMRQISALVQKNENQFGPYEIAAVMHAFSQLNCVVPRSIFHTIAPKILLSGDFNSHTACIVFGAYTRTGIDIPHDLLIHLSALMRTVKDPQYLINVVFGISRIESALDEPVLSDLLTVICETLGNSDLGPNPVNINQIIYALNKLRISQPLKLYGKAISAACDHSTSFDGLQVSNILHSLTFRRNLDDEELKLCQQLASRIPNLELSPQLLSSVYLSVVKLAIPLNAVLTSRLESRMILSSPDDSWIDVQNIVALAHSDRLTEAFLGVLLKRMNMADLEFDEVLQLLYGISFAFYKSQKLSGVIMVYFIDKIVKYTLNILDDLPSRDLVLLADMVNQVSATTGPPCPLPFSLIENNNRMTDFGVRPLDWIRETKIANESTHSGLTHLAFSIEDSLTNMTDESAKAEFCISHLESLGADCPLLSDIFENHLAGLVKSEGVGIVLLAKSVEFLSPIHDKLLEKVVLEKRKMLDRIDHRFRFAVISAFLKIGSKAVNQLLLTECFPGFIDECSVSQVVNLVTKLGPGTLPKSLGDVVVQKLSPLSPGSLDLSVVSIIAPFIPSGIRIPSVLDPGQSKSVDQLIEYINRCKHYEKNVQRELSFSILCIVPSDLHTCETKKLAKYSEVVLPFVDDKEGFDGATAILDQLMIRKSKDVRDLIPALALAVQIGDMDRTRVLVPMIVRNRDSFSRSPELVHRFRQSVAIMKIDHAEWYIQNVSQHVRKEIDDLRKCS
jgi:hypothetical protein